MEFRYEFSEPLSLDEFQSGGELFGVKLAYEAACRGDSAKAASLLYETFPKLPRPEQQKRLVAASEHSEARP